MTKNFRSWFSALSKGRKVGVVTALILVTGATANSLTPYTLKTAPEKSSAVLATQQKIEHKSETQTKPIPFTSTTVEDSSLKAGKTSVRTVGINGVETLTYDVVYIDGVETSRSITSTKVTTPPINEVIAKGTRIVLDCPNGTYINSSGNEVCRPFASNVPPAGATAQCVDGTYSYSQSRRGTCSHHGGVARWL